MQVSIRTSGTCGLGRNGGLRTVAGFGVDIATRPGTPTPGTAEPTPSFGATAGGGGGGMFNVLCLFNPGSSLPALTVTPEPTCIVGTTLAGLILK